MNQTQSYLDIHSAPHMSSAQPYGSHSATAGGMSHYPHYQQPPVMQPGPGHFAPAPTAYGAYGYTNGVTSPQSTAHQGSNSVGHQVPSSTLQLPAMVGTPSTPHTYVATPGPQQTYSTQHSFDTTGQVAPPGMRPKVTATLWEDEGSLCFQIEAKGVCVARREDNHFINGTKLLNVAGMTRGRRDGILKSEKTRHVVKIGPMHLKGVWIPFERALDFANKEKITELLYPLFVHNIGGLLYNPENSSRTSAVVAATERRRLENAPTSRPNQSSQPPSVHHHHPMTNTVGSQVSSSPHSIAPHPNAGRPALDRAHTFPTPPTSASSVMGMGGQSNSYEWGGPNLANGNPNSQPLSIDTGLSNARSMPTTPATTPPGSGIQTLQTYHGQPNFDTAKSYYPGSHAPQHSYPQPRYSQSGPTTSYVNAKNEMGPPSAPNGSTVDSDHDLKSDHYSHNAGSGHVGTGSSEAGGDGHAENGYMNSSSSAYGANRAPYGYHPSADHPHLSPEMTSSPQQNGSGRGTPRVTPGTQPQWGQEFQTPPRTATSSSLYNVLGDSRSSNSGTSADYSHASSYSGSAKSAAVSSLKRSRDDDDQDSNGRPNSRGMEPGFDLKRRKTAPQPQIGGPIGPMNNMQAIKTGGPLPRPR